MAADGEKKMITITSSEGEVFEVEEAVAMESLTIRQMIEVDCAGNVIPLPNVNSKILSKVIEYCNKHVFAKNTIDGAATGTSGVASDRVDLTNWDAEFIQVDQATLFELIQAANNLNIKGLLDLTCQTVADMIKEQSPEKIRKDFINITENDLTPEEVEEIRRDNAWAFE